MHEGFLTSYGISRCIFISGSRVSLASLAGLSLLCMLLGLLTALSYSDLVKSWRGSVAV